MILFRAIGVMVLVCLTVGVCCAHATCGDEKREGTEELVIPLDQIWAYKMPGTRPMNAGLGKGVYVAAEGPMLSEIRRVLRPEPIQGTKPIQWKEPQAGFAVQGTGMDALREAHAVLVKKLEPRKSFPAGTEISLVFFFASRWNLRSSAPS